MAKGLPILTSTEEESAFAPLKQVSLLKEEEGSFNENFLQQMIHQAPDVLPIKEFYPHVTSVYSLGCEIPVDLGERQGFIDNLLVTDDGHLILVETKLWRNPEALRAVVAQTLEYGQALSHLSLPALEARLQRADRKARVLNEGQSIIGSVSEKAAQQSSELDLTRFEEALERHLRCGEVLFLIVGDGIHPSVERMTHWLDEKAASPFKFGLVEIRLFHLPDGKRMAVPRTLIKTREISRHVVVVDIQAEGPVKTSTEVISETRTAGGGTTSQKERSKAIAEPLTSSTLLKAIRNNRGRTAESIAAELIKQLESLNLDCHATSYTLQYGIVAHGEFYSLVSLNKDGLWNQPPKKIIQVLDPSIFVEYKRASNSIALFYAESNVDNPEAYTGKTPGYEKLAGKVADFANLVEGFKTKIAEALSSNPPWISDDLTRQ